MAQNQTVSIKKISAHAVLVTRGFFAIGALAASSLLLLIPRMTRDLPHIDLAPLRSPPAWLAIALSLAIFATRGTARIPALHLWMLVVWSFALIAVGVSHSSRPS